MQSCVKNKTVGGQLVQSAVQKKLTAPALPLILSSSTALIQENLTPGKQHP